MRSVGHVPDTDMKGMPVAVRALNSYDYRK